MIGRRRTESALLRRFTQRDDERGSLAIFLMISIVGLMLAGLMVPLVITQDRTTRFDKTRVHALGAAQAGIDAALGEIRAAVGTDGYGDNGMLPCAPAGTPITGQVNKDTGAAAYSVVITYYAVGTVATPSAAMKCAQGFGTYDPVSGAVTPHFAVLLSTGTDGPALNGSTRGRTIESTYVFNAGDINIPGGSIHVYPSDSDAELWCLDVGPGTATAGSTEVGLQPCTDDPSQIFAYRSNLTLQLKNSVGATYADGLCIDIKTFSSGAAASGSHLVMNECSPANAPVTTWSQQWSFSDYSAFQASRSDSVSTGTLSSYCMAVGISTLPAEHHIPDSAVQLQTCINDITDPRTAFIPSPPVGAGAATSPTSMQWINFQQYGRCINATGAQTNPAYVIAPGCKQNPKPGAINWNQEITYNSTTQQFYFTTGGTNYCLYSQSTAAVPKLDSFIKMTPCSNHSGITNAQLLWTRTTPVTDPTLPFSQQFRFVNAGLCMSLKDVDTADNYRYWPKLVITTCDSSPTQQWNVSSPGPSSVQNTQEK